jgi:S-adenosylmethionine synthetase
MRNIVIEKSDEIPIEEREIEIVERKGIGHPDSICDAIAEISSQALSQYYLKRFGQVLHHNLDKGLLIAGKSQPKFGGGKVLEPIKIIVAGRATDRVSKIKIPVEKIVKKAAIFELKETVNSRGGEKYFEISVDYKPGAANLQEVFKRGNKISLANDTSFGVGYGPFSKTEKLTLAVANLINSQKFIKKFPFIGKDIKVMALREKEDVILTVVSAYIDKYIKNVKEYFEATERVKKEIEKYVKKNFNFKRIKIYHNSPLDDPNAKDEAGIYLTVLGLSAEQGDDGQVGRGNRVSGLITPCREMSLEAAAGKNINHPGKLYQILAHLIAQEIGKIKGVKECSVKILSQIGKPLDQPQVASVKLFAKNFNSIEKKAFKIVNSHFDRLREIQLEIVKGKYSLF